MGLRPEEREQAAVFDWLGWQWPVLHDVIYHVKNEGIKGSRGQQMAYGRKMKRLGVKAGVVDIVVDVPAGIWPGLRIELKPRDSGSLSQDQRRVLGAMNRQGYLAVMCKGADEAITVLKAYLEPVCRRCGIDRGGPCECEEKPVSNTEVGVV